MFVCCGNTEQIVNVPYITSITTTKIEFPPSVCPSDIIDIIEPANAAVRPAQAISAAFSPFV